MPSEKLSVAKTLRSNGILGVIRGYTSGSGAYNPATGTVNPRSNPADDSTRAMMLLDQLAKTPSRTFSHGGSKWEPNTLIEGVEKWALVDATGRAPRIQDRLYDGSEEWYILNVQEIADESGPILYILALKK